MKKTEAINLLFRLYLREMSSKELSDYYSTQTKFDDYVERYLKTSENPKQKITEKVIKTIAKFAIENDGFDYLLQD